MQLARQGEVDKDRIGLELELFATLYTSPVMRMTRSMNQEMPESPCINLCRLDASKVFCLGCFRTIDEISLWSQASNDELENILAAAARRRTEWHAHSANRDRTRSSSQ